MKGHARKKLIKNMITFEKAKKNKINNQIQSSHDNLLPCFSNAYQNNCKY